MTKWETKGGPKENKNKFGTTDNDIPMFTYKSSLFIFVVTTIFVVLGNLIGKAVNDNTKIIASLIGAFGVGSAMGLGRYFIDTKRGKTKGFWITSTLWFIGAFIFLWLFYKLNVLM